jgi:hypothetical protein
MTAQETTEKAPGIEEVMARDAEFRAEAAASACDPVAETSALQEIFEGLCSQYKIRTRQPACEGGRCVRTQTHKSTHIPTDKENQSRRGPRPLSPSNMKPACVKTGGAKLTEWRYRPFSAGMFRSK